MALAGKSLTNSKGIPAVTLLATIGKLTFDNWNQVTATTVRKPPVNDNRVKLPRLDRVDRRQTM